MSTSFYAGPSTAHASVEIAFRENGGNVHLKATAPLGVCPCCLRKFEPGAVIAHDEYGSDFTREGLADELGIKPPA